MAFMLKINGANRSVDVDGDTALLWVLRDVLGMTGTKFGCGMALCGACTVHIDGAATRSCITSVDSVGKSAIATIEAIGSTAAGTKIQRAGSIGRFLSAATASRARSCRLRRCSRVIHIPLTQ
jgi:isoquinoline 1-oxidoreductase alpha subunit